MKKTVFTICSIIALCSIIFLACTKDDNTSTKVTYANQPGVGSGGNPNPNSNPSSSGFSTAGTTGTTTTPPPTTYGTMTDNGTNFTFTTSSACGAATMTGSCSDGTLQLSFSAAPTAGTYTTVQSGATAGQVIFVYGGAIAPNGSTVTVAPSGTKFAASFSNIVIGSKTLSGSLTCQ